MQYRSWFRFLAIPAPATLIVALAIAMFVATASVQSDLSPKMEPGVPNLANDAVSVGPREIPPVPTRTFSGVITDDHCGARHDMHSDKSPSECIQACLRRGADYILVNGDKTYRLEGNPEELAGFAGTRVKLTGSLAGNRISVSSIAWD